MGCGRWPCPSFLSSREEGIIAEMSCTKHVALLFRVAHVLGQLDCLVLSRRVSSPTLCTVSKILCGIV